MLGGAVGTKSLSTADTPGESGRMSKILAESFERPARESVLVQSKTLEANDPGFRAAVDDVVGRVQATGVATDIRDPLEPGNAEGISEDGRSALITFDIRGDPEQAADKIDSVRAAVDEAKPAPPAFFIGGLGEASADKEIEELVGKDLEQAGMLSLPVTDRGLDRGLRRPAFRSSSP